MTVGATVDEKTIGNAAGTWLRWSLLSTVGAKPLTFAVGIVLARLLTLADFGTFAPQLISGLYGDKMRSRPWHCGSS